MAKSPASILYNPDGDAPLAIDTITDTLAVILFGHYKVHDGKHYTVQNWQDVNGAGTTFDIFIKGAAFKYPHLLYSFSSGSEFTFILYEAPTVSADGTAETIFNNNRNSANTAGLTVYRNPTVTTVGTQLLRGQLSTGLKEGGSVSRDSEFILKQDEDYLLRFTKVNAGTHFLAYGLSWYE